MLGWVCDRPDEPPGPGRAPLVPGLEVGRAVFLELPAAVAIPGRGILLEESVRHERTDDFAIVDGPLLRRTGAVPRVILPTSGKVFQDLVEAPFQVGQNT